MQSLIRTHIIVNCENLLQDSKHYNISNNSSKCPCEGDLRRQSQATSMEESTILRKKPKILLTSFSDEERKRLSDKIRDIGGILYESSNFTPLATHIICKMPSRSEKFICACAAGKWVLSQSYIDESYSNNQWLDEKPFEWSQSDISSDSSHKELFALPRRWREQLSLQKGAFSNWIVVLSFKNMKRREAFRRLIEAGKGRVVYMRTPYYGKQLEMIKYVISEDIKNKELLPFKRANVPIIGSEAVMDYIIKGKKPKVSKHQGAIDSTSRKHTLPIKHGVKEEFPNSNSPLKDNMHARKQADRDKKIQQKVTSYFNGLKNRATLLAEKRPLDGINVNSASKKCDLVEQFMVSKREVNRNPPSLKNSDSEHSEKPNYGRRPCLNTGKSSISNCSTVPMLDKQFSMGIGHRAEVEKRLSTIGESSSHSGNHSKRAQPLSNEMSHNLGGTNMQQVTKSEQNHLNHSQPDRCDMTLSMGSSSPSALNQSPSNRHDMVPSIDSSNPCVLNQSQSSHQSKVPSKGSSSPCALKQDPASIGCIDLTTSQSFVEDVSLNKDTTSIAKKSSENLSNIRQRITRKRLRGDIDMGMLYQSRDSVLKSNIKQSCRDAPKKQKLGSDFKSAGISLRRSRREDHASRLDHLLIEDVHRKRVQLHNCGTDTIEGCLEEGLHKESLKLMGSFLSSTFYLPSNTITTLMNMLRPSSKDYNGELLSCIRSLLNRCITLHPSHAIPDVYVTSLKLAGKGTGAAGSNDAFEFIASVFREAQCVLVESGDDIQKIALKSLLIWKRCLPSFSRKQSLLSLAKFITAILEVDSDFHWKRYEAGISCLSDRKSILGEIHLHPMDRKGSGTNVKKLIKLAMEMAVESTKNHQLVPLRGMVFTLLKLVAQSCQMSDMQTISAKYGPACTNFTYELYEFMCSLSNDASRREIALHTIFSSLMPNWLAARVADLFISTYDASCVSGAERELLRKPLTLEKIVSCYFFFIPTNSNGSLYFSNRKNSQPLKEIGDNNTGPAKLDSETKKEKTITKRNAKGETKLHVACIRNKPAEVKKLLLFGIDPNIKDNAGWTALHEASNHGNDSCVAELLVSKDLDIFATSIDDYTALHDAAENNHYEVVKLLIKSGGMTLLNMRTSFGATAFDLASTPMKSLLSELENDLNCGSSILPIYPTSVMVQSQDIDMFLRLLIVLLRNFAPESNEELSLTAKLTLLKGHIRKLKKDQSKTSILLFNIVSNMLC